MNDQIHKIINKCLKCGVCVEKCEYLNNYCNKCPVDLAEGFLSGKLKNNVSALFTCNLCSLCEEVCPENLNIGTISLKLRQEYVAHNGGVSKLHKPLLETQSIYVSEKTKTALCGYEQNSNNLKGEKMLFFPGCSLSLNSPYLVKKHFLFYRNDYLE